MNFVRTNVAAHFVFSTASFCPDSRSSINCLKAEAPDLKVDLFNPGIVAMTRADLL